MNGWFKSTVAGVIIGIGIVLSRDYIFAERGEPDSFFFAISRSASAVVNIFIKSRHAADFVSGSYGQSVLADVLVCR